MKKPHFLPLLLGGLCCWINCGIVASGEPVSLRQKLIKGDLRLSNQKTSSQQKLDAMKRAYEGALALHQKQAFLQRTLGELPNLRIAILSEGQQIIQGTLVSERGFVVAKRSLLPGNPIPALEGQLPGYEAMPLFHAATSEADDLALFILATDSAARPLPVPRMVQILPEAGTVARAQNGTNEMPILGTIAVSSRPIRYQRPSAKEHQIEIFHQRAGIRVSQRRCGFPLAIETDLDISPENCGTPVFDPRNRLIGIAIARATKTATYVIPANRIQALLKLGTIPGNPKPVSYRSVFLEADTHSG